MQVVGKYRLARTPWINHSWHATFYVTPRGLTTSMIADGPGGIEIELDFLDHAVVGSASSGRTERFDLGPTSVREFHGRFLELVKSLGGTPRIHGRPSEIPNPVPFAEDREPRPYDADAVSRFHRALVLIVPVLTRFRSGFVGKASPVHLFWGALDLAVTRFSGRRAPLHPGGFPSLPDAVAREAYSHEVSSAGFWPGGGGIDYPAFYSYAYPEPQGFKTTRVAPADAFYAESLGEFVLRYDAVREAGDPEAVLMSFLESTYGAAADRGGWDRPALECPFGEPLRPRPLS